MDATTARAATTYTAATAPRINPRLPVERAASASAKPAKQTTVIRIRQT